MVALRTDDELVAQRDAAIQAAFDLFKQAFNDALDAANANLENATAFIHQDPLFASAGVATAATSIKTSLVNGLIAEAAAIPVLTVTYEQSGGVWGFTVPLPAPTL